MKAAEQYSPVVQFVMLYKAVLTFESVDKILKSNRSNESYSGALLYGAVFFPVFIKES